MKHREAVSFLKNNPVFFSRLGFGYAPPIKNAQGKPLVFTEDLERYATTHRMFSAAGVKIQTSILHAGWMGIDEFDYSLTDRTVDAISGKIFREISQISLDDLNTNAAVFVPET